MAVMPVGDAAQALVRIATAPVWAVPVAIVGAAVSAGRTAIAMYKIAKTRMASGILVGGEENYMWARSLCKEGSGSSESHRPESCTKRYFFG